MIKTTIYTGKSTVKKPKMERIENSGQNKESGSGGRGGDEVNQRFGYNLGLGPEMHSKRNCDCPQCQCQIGGLDSYKLWVVENNPTYLPGQLTLEYWIVH